MNFDNKWSELIAKEDYGSRNSWQEAKEKANNYQQESSNPTPTPTPTAPAAPNPTPAPTPAPTPTAQAAPNPTPAPSAAAAAPAQSSVQTNTPKSSLDYTREDHEARMAEGKLPAISTQQPGYATDRMYYGPEGGSKLYTAKEADDAGWSAGYYNPGQAGEVKPMSAAAQRIANNEAIIADRGSDRQVAYQQELDDLKQSTGYGTGGTGDVRAHLREKIEGGWVSTEPLNKYTGTSWMRADGATGNLAAMNRLKQIAYGDTPTSFTDMRRFGDEGYVPMAERPDTQWRDWTPSGGSDKDGYFKGMYELKKKYGYTSETYDAWNNNRIQGNRELANRHGSNIDAQFEAGLIDKYGNPIEPEPIY